MAPGSANGDALWQRVRAQGKAKLDAYVNGDGKELPSYQRLLLGNDIGIMSMIEALADHVEEMEVRLSASPMEYRGTWREGRRYSEKTFITHNGCVWFTAVPTERKPGEGVDWVLAVRAGKDGKDARP